MGGPLHYSAPTYWDLWEAFPPIIVRLSARRCVCGDHVVALSATEIAIASDIPLSRVLEISPLFSWTEVTMGEAKQFCRACEFDPTSARDRRRQRDYLRSCHTHTTESKSHFPRFLKCSPFWSTELMPLVLLLRSQRMSSDESRPSVLLAARSAA